MQMLKKLFSSDNKYYLELKEEIEDSEVVQTAIKTAEKTAEVVKEKAQEVAESKPVQSAVNTASEVIDVAQDKVASAIAKEKLGEREAKATEAKDKGKSDKAVKNDKAAVKGSKQTTKNNQAANQNGKQEGTAKTAAEKAGASSFDPPFWVAAMNNTNNKPVNGNGAVAKETFAENNLMPIATKYRRRPGGSLDKFKDMAKSAKTPRR